MRQLKPMSIKKKKVTTTPWKLSDHTAQVGKKRVRMALTMMQRRGLALSRRYVPCFLPALLPHADAGMPVQYTSCQFIAHTLTRRQLGLLTSQRPPWVLYI